MKKTVNKTTKNNFITYGMVIAIFAVVQILSSTGNLSRLLTGLLVPICRDRSDSAEYGCYECLDTRHGSCIWSQSRICRTKQKACDCGKSGTDCESKGNGCVYIDTHQLCIAYSPLRKASSNLAVLITAIGVSYLLQNLALLIFGADAKSFVAVIKFPSITLFDGELTIKGITIVTILACIIIMVGLSLFVKKTKPGRAMQAVSEDRDAAQLMGVNVNATISLTFAIGSGLAAIAGLLLCQTYPTLTPYTGAMPGIKAFVAAVFGGIGSIPGAMVGGILLGIIEIFGKAYISSQVADAIVFAVLIVVLLVKPTGLFGKNIQEKV